MYIYIYSYIWVSNFDFVVIFKDQFTRAINQGISQKSKGD